MNFHSKQEQRSEKVLLESIFSSLQDGLVVIDSDYNIITVNSTAKKLFGKKSLVGKKCFTALSGSAEPCQKCVTMECLNSKKPGKWVRNSVDNREFETSYFPLVNIDSNQVNGVIVYIRDITERSKVESEMTRLENLNLIGEMAASIAHEVRNPMTTVRGFLQLLQTKELYHQDREFFDLMIAELDRANGIISQFLSLGRNKNLNLTHCNLVALLNSLLLLIQATAVKSGHSIETRLRKVPSICIDQDEIRQLILNLVQNGLEAMPNGGRLLITTSVGAEKVIINISDQGNGIPKEILNKLGTPFISTKDKGTGLGLAACYNLAARNNATIKVKTSKKGTTFKIMFDPVGL